MSIRIEQYTGEHLAAWEAFVAASRNGTLFHTRRFLSYHEEGKFTDASLLFFEEDQLIGVLPAALLQESQGAVLVSHPGASYGGLVLRTDGGMRETGRIVEALQAYLREQHIAEARFLRLTPPSVRRQASDDQEFWLYHGGFRVFRFELATSLFLHGEEEEQLLLRYTGKCRNAVRQGSRSGITVGLSEDATAFWPILEGALSERHSTHPTHTLAQFQRLQACCPGEVRLLAAFEGTKMIAGIAFVTLHDDSLYTLYIAQDFAFQHLRPLPLLMHELLKLAVSEHRTVVHFGISTEDAGKTVNDGLFFFKESFGGQSVRHESWQYPPIAS